MRIGRGLASPVTTMSEGRSENGTLLFTTGRPKAEACPGVTTEESFGGC